MEPLNCFIEIEDVEKLLIGKTLYFKEIPDHKFNFDFKFPTSNYFNRLFKCNEPFNVQAAISSNLRFNKGSIKKRSTSE
jgi:hypothetical protein